MTVEELIIYGKKYIHSDFVNMLLSNLLDLNSLELLNHLNDNVNINIINEYKKQVEMVRNNKPIQYVIGNVDFYGNIIEVNENVLIPRFETEELVEKTIKYLKEFDNPDIVDIGTGSGCIAITLKKELNCNVDAVDISDKALEIAKKNIDKYNLDINLYHGNLLEPLNKKYDCIISNPPYLTHSDDVMDIVKNNEPNVALYAEDNGLYYYKEIMKNSKNYLKDKFLIAFEIGMEQGEVLKQVASIYYPNSKITVEQDLQGRDRFLFILCK